MDDFLFLSPTADPGTAMGGGISFESGAALGCWMGVEVEVKLELDIPEVWTKSMGRLMRPRELGWLWPPSEESEAAAILLTK